jgi:hypothetical protein
MSITSVSDYGKKGARLHDARQEGLEAIGFRRGQGLARIALFDDAPGLHEDDA